MKGYKLTDEDRKKAYSIRVSFPNGPESYVDQATLMDLFFSKLLWHIETIEEEVAILRSNNG